MSTEATAAAQFAQNAEGLFVCPECGNAYARARATRRHMTAKHGWDPAKSSKTRALAHNVKETEAPAEDTISFQVRAELRELAAPLQEKIATLDRRLVVLNREAQDLRDARQQIERTLRGLMGPQQGSSYSGNTSAVYRKKTLAVQAYLKKLPEHLQEGFTANSLADSMKADGVTPALSSQTAARIIQEMHEQGVLRLDRISKGGGKSYLLAGRNGNMKE